jgi:hypothetical protein
MLRNAADYEAEVIKLIERKRTVVQVDSDVIKINLGDHDPYKISLHQIDSERRILEWVLHLSTRTDVELLTIEAFIEKALEHLDKIRSHFKK